MFDIAAYGARPDGRTLSTHAIQKAIDACHQAGGGRVLCGAGHFVSGTITLKSHVELHLAPGCRLQGSRNIEDYTSFASEGLVPGPAVGFTQSLICAAGADNIAITGAGELNGSGLAFFDPLPPGARFFRKPTTPRPRLVVFHRCRNVRIEAVSVIDAPCYALWLMQCEQIGIHRVRILCDQRMINSDGINLDACRDAVVSDCIIRTGDDCLAIRAIREAFATPALCENITVSNCVLDSWCNGVRVGCPGDNIIRNCTLSNLVIRSACNGILFENPARYLPADGRATADISRILFSNVSITCNQAPIKVIIEAGIAVKRIAGLSFSDFRVQGGAPCQIQGSPESPVQDVRLANVTIESAVPEPCLLHNCRNVTFHAVSFQ